MSAKDNFQESDLIITDIKHKDSDDLIIKYSDLLPTMSIWPQKIIVSKFVEKDGYFYIETEKK